MGANDGFHPDFDDTTTEVTRNRVHHIKASDISSDTTQSEGVRRFVALSGRSVGAEKLWMGETHVSPQTMSSNHHHLGTNLMTVRIDPLPAGHETF